MNNLNSTHGALLGNNCQLSSGLIAKNPREAYRMRKSLLFRAKQRKKRTKVIAKVKNINRQKAAFKRQRDKGGKFLKKPITR